MMANRKTLRAAPHKMAASTDLASYRFLCESAHNN
jgi:hypothetical protein